MLRSEDLAGQVMNRPLTCALGSELVLPRGPEEGWGSGQWAGLFMVLFYLSDHERPSYPQSVVSVTCVYIHVSQ